MNHHIVMVGFDVDAETYQEALDRVELFLREHREGHTTTDIWPEGCVRVFTVPALPHQPISMNVEKMSVSVDIPVVWDEGKPTSGFIKHGESTTHKDDMGVD